MKTKIFLFSLFVILFHLKLASQNLEKILAQIGNQKIIAKEFKLRYELSPFVSHRSKWNQDTIKTDFLFSMIAERLWYLDALDKGLENSEEFRFYFKPLQDIFLRDYLFKQEIEEKIKLTANDVSNAIYKAQFKIKSKILNSNDSIKIFTIHSLLNEKITLDSILKIPEYAFLSSGEFEISLGSLKDEEVEDYLFSLNPGEHSKPIKSEIGWVIFYITDKLFTPIDLSNQKAVENTKRIVKSRKAMIKAQEYLQEILGNKIYNIDDTLFNQIFELIYKRIIEKSEKDGETIQSFYVLNDNDYRIIKLELGDTNLRKSLFKISEMEVTAWDFLANLAFEEHKFQSKDKNKIYSQLSKIVKDFVYQQRLVYEAKKLNIDKNKNLLDELQNWKINFLSTQLRLSYLDSARVTDEEVLNYFNNEFRKDKTNLLIKMRILNLENLDEVEKTLEQISSGKSFKEIIKSYGKTDSLTNDSGETPLLPHFHFGDLGIIASKLNLNEVYGPINRNGMYSIIEVIDKKEMPDTFQIDIESSKNYIKNFLFLKKFNELTSQKTFELAEKYGVKIYEDVLKEIKTTTIPMFVHRFMGFGGRIAGVPLLDNWFQFVDIKEFKSKVQP